MQRMDVAYDAIHVPDDDGLFYYASEVDGEVERLHARIAELEAQLATYRKDATPDQSSFVGDSLAASMRETYG